ncbi:hypothetical protein K461DRAFT_282324 [Myriangium duriaei CBS 260.36]|uniref:DNA polymerase delta subunit 4 n=1 Tax=Myriangium duriaei CBS 260.36 TaxID=1168546 RepID=A0A9P4IY43_9PEZI|nr:hypothetical protein K461DRAFT_282324 [Myriangium duriaei CBS 260.36]
MPPKRATRAAAARRSQPGQGTLSFSKGQANRVTKQTTSPRGKGLKKDPSLLKVESDQSETTEPEVASITAPSGPPAAADPLTNAAVTKTEDVLGGRASPELEDAAPEQDPEEAEDDANALSIKPPKIKAYWRQKEQARLAPRVHQQDLTLSEKILREWDMSGQYGPCIGITREKRWRRARKLGLEPPMEVLAVLLGGLDGDGAGKGAVEDRAHVDLLMGNRFEVMA